MICKKCKNKALHTGMLIRCKNKLCGIVYWSYSIKNLDLNNDLIFEKVLKEAKVKRGTQLNKRKNRTHYVYVIKIRKTKNFIYYRGMTGLHPYERYLNHIRGYKSNKYVKKKHSYLLKYEGPMSFQAAKKREHSIAEELDGPSYGK